MIMDINDTEKLGKACSICNVYKSYDLFPKYTKTGKPRKWCRECMKTYKRNYPSTNSGYRLKTQARLKKIRNDLADKTYSYLRLHPCVDCGETRILFLQFDHVRGVKTLGISRMISNMVKWEIILEEIVRSERC